MGLRSRILEGSRIKSFVYMAIVGNRDSYSGLIRFSSFGKHGSGIRIWTLLQFGVQVYYLPFLNLAFVA